MLLSSLDTRGPLMHLILFTNTAQRELVSICTQRIRNSNQLSMPYYLGNYELFIYVVFQRKRTENLKSFSLKSCKRTNHQNHPVDNSIKINEGQAESHRYHLNLLLTSFLVLSLIIYFLLFSLKTYNIYCIRKVCCLFTVSFQ